MSNLLKKEKGFTLIEIVLVLAIAGLLLVIVFLAVSGAQKSRRDSQRKSDNARIEAALESYASNNNGAYPYTAAVLATFGTQYLATGFTAPDGALYNATLTFKGAPIPATNPVITTPDTVYYYVNNVTNGRNVEVCMGLETGTQCLSNQ